MLVIIIIIIIIILLDACPGNQTTCHDNVYDLQAKLNGSHKLLRSHIIRAHPSDKGYKVLSCKLRTGMRKIYEQFPNRKYYFKIDTDTILFPRRFFSFLNTLEATTDSIKTPLYFGTIVESGMNLLLCGRNWENNGIIIVFIIITILLLLLLVIIIILLVIIFYSNHSVNYIIIDIIILLL